MTLAEIRRGQPRSAEEDILGLNQLRILLDLDGTVAQNAGRKLAAAQFGVDLDAESGLSLPERLGLTTDQFWEWWHTHQEEIYERAEPLPGAAVVLRGLKQSGAYIAVVTARRDEARAVTTAWLERFGFPFDTMVFSSDDKLAVAKALNLNVGFEDDPANALSLAEWMPMILVDNHKNRREDVAHPQVFRVQEWNEVPGVLRQLSVRTA